LFNSRVIGRALRGFSNIKNTRFSLNIIKIIFNF